MNGAGEHSPFGGIVVGATTGRVLRGSITYGNNGPTRRYSRARQVLAAIRALIRNASHERVPTHVARVARLTDNGVEMCDFNVTLVEALTADGSRVRFPDGSLRDVVNDALRPV